MSDPEADYYRLRTEWLRYKSHLHDRLTGLPALAAVTEDVRRLLETQRGVELLYVDLGRSGWHETELGWAAYDRAVRDCAALFKAFRGAGLLAPSDVLCLSTVRSDRFLTFMTRGDGGLPAPARCDRLLMALRDAIQRVPKDSPLFSLRVAAGRARVGEHPMVRPERAIQHAVSEATLMSMLEREGGDPARHAGLAALIASGQVRSVFDPIVRLADRTVIGHEALTRADSHGAFESIEDLFAFAETTDLIVEFERLCRRTAIGAAAGRPGLDLFLNASARAVLDPDWLHGETPALLRAAGLEPRQVVVEVTERVAVAKHEGFAGGLLALKERGYRVAVDDMGAGHSSFQALAEIEPDFLKFDTSLVRDIDKSSIKRSLLDTLRSLGDKIHARVIAEGIEREEELMTLVGLGIELGQGYYFGHGEGHGA